MIFYNRQERVQIEDMVNNGIEELQAIDRKIERLEKRLEEVKGKVNNYVRKNA